MLLLLGCGKSGTEGDPSGGSGASPNPDGGGATHGGDSGGYGGALSGGSGGTPVNPGSGGAGAGDPGAGGQGPGGQGPGGAIGNGERDLTCTERTSNHVGGERIVLKTASTAEGDEIFLGFFDTEKELECTIRVDAEGKHRCMPLTRGDKEYSFFSDSACAEQIDYRGICARDHDAVRVTDDPCDQRRRFFALGDPLPDQEVYELNDEGVCESYGSINHLRTLGPELDPAEYVEVQPVVWRGVGRLWTQGFSSADGLQVMTGVFDSGLNHACDFALSAEQEERCFPAANGIVGFTDPTCTETLIARPTDTGVDECGEPYPAYATRVSDDACSPSVSLYEVTVAYQGERYLESSCTVAMNQSTPVFRAAEVDESTIARASTTLGGADKRLRPMYREVDDGGCFFQGWWDAELETECTFEALNDTEYYCLPVDRTDTTVRWTDTFSDDACEVPAPYLRVENCKAETVPRYSLQLADRCVSGWGEVRPVAPAPAALPALWVQSGDACEPFEPSPNAAYHALGDTLPTSAFVPATLNE